ncbi:MAG TPA: HEAT repeat domain-containing protein [Candidatus Limnocylindrales bacterium]|nr:HEAT repeat domain-containing protein [Candidatus Limnocylindrales bacterium]
MIARTHVIVALAVSLVGLLYFTSFADYGFNREDEGTLLMQFWRWSRGEVPYLDFHFGYTPGVHTIHQMLMRWFGPSVMPGRYLLAAVNAGALTTLFLVTVTLTRSWKWALMAPLLYLASMPVFPGDFASFNIPYPVWYNVLLFGLSAVLLFPLRRTPTLPLLIAHGALAGLGFTFKPNVGLFQLAAAALVALAAHGRPRGFWESLLWWAWWLAVQLGLLFVFASAPTGGEIFAFVGPVTACALAIARDAYRHNPRRDIPALLGSGLALGAGFLLVGTPWLVWAYSILGAEWFTRRALFLGTGFESFYYLGGPPIRLDVLAVIGSGLVWFAPAWLRARGWHPWKIVVGAVAAVAVLFAAVVATRPMPSGFYASLMVNLEPRAFAAATFVQWLAIFAWLARRREPGDRTLGVEVLGPAILAGILLYLQIFPRTDFMHWVTAMPLLFPLVVWGLQAVTIRWSAASGATARRAVGVAVSLPVLAIALIRVGHFLDARWDLRGAIPVRTPETRLAVPHAPFSINAGHAGRFRELERVVELIDAQTGTRDAVFTFPALDFVSFLALRSPGNRHGYYFPGWPGHDAEVEVLTALEREPPRLVVTLREHQLFFADAHAYYFFFADFVERNYAPLVTIGRYSILARKDLALAPIEDWPTPAAVADALGTGRMADLQSQLESESRNDRLRAVAAMSELEIAGDFELLRSALSDEDPEVRSAAVKAADRSRAPAVRDALIAGVIAGAFESADAVRALRTAGLSCDSACIGTVVPLLEADDDAVAGAARNLLLGLGSRKWRSSFWWHAGRDGDGEAIQGEVAAKLREVMAEPDSDPLLRELAFAHAAELGVGGCPRSLRVWSTMRPRWLGLDRTAVLALLHLARHRCSGNRLDAAARWFTIDSVLAPRVALMEARRNPEAADAILARHAAAGFARASATAMWLCSIVGGSECLSAARQRLEPNASEEERVAAAWAWSQLAADEADIEELQAMVKNDASPQVRETAGYGVVRWGRVR